MRFLLDTHVAIWAIFDDRRLKPATRRRIIDLDNEIFVSVVTLWEIAIKFARRRGRPNDMPISAAQALTFFADAGYRVLDITAAHALALHALPAIHGDPFDRMLIAQARSEPLRLLTSDATVAAYGDVVELV
jgi:PIN domain nuclease of toxin-antitoxin system